MTATRGNLRRFTAAPLPADQFANARGYVCYERNLYYAYACRRQLRVFPLFFMDRFLGWRYDGGAEPLLAQFDGFHQFLDEHVRAEVNVPGRELKNLLLEVFGRGDTATVETWVRHTDGAPYVTSILLEGMDEAGVVYYAKFNDMTNGGGLPVTFESLLDWLYVYPGGTSLVTILREAPVVQELTGADSGAAARRVFGALYGYGWAGGTLTHRGHPVRPRLDGFDEFLAAVNRGRDGIITPDGVPKRQQFRLGRNVLNRFEPIQQYLRFVRADPTLRDRLTSDTRAALDDEIDRMDAVLRDVMKFVSLLTVRPGAEALEYYLDSIRRLRDAQPSYRATNLSVLSAITA